MKFGFASLLGEDTYQKMSNFFSQLSKTDYTSKKDLENPNRTDLNLQPSIGSDELNIMGSMTIMTFSGYIEDYLNQLKVLIFKQLIDQGNTEKAINLIEKFSRSYITNRVNILLEGMKLRSIVFKSLNEYSDWILSSCL